MPSLAVLAVASLVMLLSVARARPISASRRGHGDRRLSYKRLVYTPFTLSLLLFFVDDLLGCFLQSASSVGIPELSHTLTEIDLDTSLINKHALHPAVSLHAVSFPLVFNKCVLQGVSGLPISDDFARADRTKPREYQLQIMGLGNWVQLADEKDCFRRLDVRIRQIL